MKYKNLVVILLIVISVFYVLGRASTQYNQDFPVYNPNGTVQTSSTIHAIIGTCTLGTSCVVTLTGKAAFTSATSYSCAASDFTGINAIKVVQAAGTITITGIGTDVIQFLCVGS